MAASHRRHDRRNDLSDQLSEQVWEGLKPHLPGVAGKVGGPALDNRLFLAVFECGILKFAYRRALAGSAPGYGDWKNTHRRCSRGGTGGLEEAAG